MSEVTQIKRRRGGESTKPIRWNLSQAAREFGKPYEILARAQRGLGIAASEDGCYTTRQIAAMVFGDKEAEALGKLAAERKNAELRNARETGELVPTSTLIAVMEPVAIAIRQKILSSVLSDSEKDGILAELVKLGEIDWLAEAKRAGK